MRQGTTIWHKSQVTIKGVAIDFGTLYGTGDPVVPAPPGTLLNDYSLGAVIMSTYFKSTVTVNNHTYNDGDIAISLISHAPIDGIFTAIDTDGINPISSIPEGLAGSEKGVPYRMKVTFIQYPGGNQSDPPVEVIIADEEIKVYAPASEAAAS